MSMITITKTKPAINEMMIPPGSFFICPPLSPFMGRDTCARAIFSAHFEFRLQPCIHPMFISDHVLKYVFPDE